MTNKSINVVTRTITAIKARPEATQRILKGIWRQLDGDESLPAGWSIGVGDADAAGAIAILEALFGPVHGPARNPKHKQCACGCEGWTRGGLWLPGHDAKAASAAARSAGTLKKMPRPCKCGCGDTTKGGTFCPGHDAKYHSALRQTVTLEQVAA